MWSLRALLSIGIQARRVAPDLSPPLGSSHLSAPARLELLSVYQRTAAMTWLAEMTDGWPGSFRRLAAKAGLTQRSFARFTPRALEDRWLASEVALLPDGRRRRRLSLGQRVAERLGAIPINANSNWRSLRAEALMREVTPHGH